ncbi:MAG: peptide ABC transporter substrate-binding protein, partial [Gammaproteobacteria bacterium]|nr:peptide ABC transporter substrate-binding protein [Gammaproteobacteria bacterium]
MKRGNGGDPGSLDPVLAEDVHAFNVLLDLYEGLLTVSADGTIAPGVAASWEVSPDGLEYRFNLRPDAVWSNGRPVTAQHFVAGFRHGVRSGSQSPSAFLLAPLANYQQVLNGVLPVEALGIRAEDDHTLVIELEHPASYFPGILTMPIAYPRLPDVHDDSASFRIPSRFVGNGPYVLDGWQPGGVLQLRRSRTFRAADAATIEFVQYYPNADPAAELNLYRAGQLDITATIPPAAFTSVRRERPREVHLAPGLALYYLAFDLSEPPLDNPALRKALSMAIDRQRLVEILGRGEQAAYGLVPPGVHGHVPASYLWRDAPRAQREAQARQTYAEAGYRNGLPPIIQLTYDAGDIHEKVALAVRSMWQEVLGIDVSLRRMEWKSFLDTRNDRSAWQVMRFVWVGDFDDASTFTDVFTSGSEQNLPGYSNRRYDELLKRASVSSAEEVRQQLLTEAEHVLIEDYPIVPLYFLVSKHLVSPRVQGYL